ncbi:MAG: FAD-dependent oxidoreductase [Anaerolineales bacterium]|nr:FAD-dependent oxidoreductase [Anaerolineales bacterium]
MEKLTRKQFVKGAALGIVAASGATALTGCGAKPATGLPEEWDNEADVVVVGFGGAGAAAAIEAGRAGASVIVLERTTVGGGSTALCGGIVYMGGGTPVQKAAGFEDTLEGMNQYLLAAAGAGADPEMINTYCNNNLDLYDWLTELGVAFKESFIAGRFPTPPTDDGLCYSGNELQAAYSAVTPPVPRGHHVKSPGSSGAVLWPPLSDGAKAAGAEIMVNTKANNLIVNPEGRVVGVTADKQGREINIKAKKAVILTSGGFAFNPEMVNQYCPEFASAYPLGTEGDDGSGIRIGQGAGADLRLISSGDASSFVYLGSEVLIKGVLVNPTGRRFVGEDNYGSWVGDLLVKHYPIAYLIVDSAIWEEAKPTIPEGYAELCTPIAQADSLAELAAALYIPPEMLENTVALYNQFAAAGTDLEMYKESQYLVSLENAPFYALGFYPQAASFFTMGGLRINTAAQVLDEKGEPIPGLYSAGRNAAAVSASQYPGSGTSVGEALTFGRIAGQGAAALTTWEEQD